MEEENNNMNNFDNIINKYIKKDKINHAYLIETNNLNRLELATTFANKILSLEEKNKIEDLKRDFDLQIIKTEAQSIKKEEIIELKEKFKTKSIYNSKRIYIIEEAEKLNTSSANTLLKFLEEPEDNIIAILITSNRNLVINTIVSRCQIIRYYTNQTQNTELDNEQLENLLTFAIDFENKKEKTIAYINKYYTKQMSDRNTLAKFLKNLLYLYSDVLHYKIGVDIEYFFLYEEQIGKISKYNKIEDIENKINAINTCIDRLKYNPNIKLLLDKLIILMSGVDVNV